MSSRSLTLKNKIEVEKLIKIAPFKKSVRKTNPHKHNNYFEIIYLSKGTGFHYIDLVKYKVKPYTVYIIRQEQVHYWELESEPEGYVMIIKRPFIEDCLDHELMRLFSEVSDECCLQLKEHLSIEILLNLLSEENDNKGKNAKLVIQGLVKAFLAKVLESSIRVGNKRVSKPDLYQSFCSMLSNNNGVKSKIQFYAEKLNTSPQNLNAACRKAANQSATEVLSGFIISEAKRLLLYTEKTVSEISFCLEFADPSYFVKYFKRITGRTPLEFRTSSYL